MLVVSTHPSDHRMTSALREHVKHIDAPDWAIVSGDRKEMLEAVIDLHYKGVKLAHVEGGDTRRHLIGAHPDHACRDAITALSSVHFCANKAAYENVWKLVGNSSIRITGNPGLDEVVRYAATLDPDRERKGTFQWFPEVYKGAEGVWQATNTRLDPETFLHTLAHCKLFKTNSSAGLLEAPIFNTPVEMVGDRQKGRVAGPYHHPEGKACETIAKIMREICKT